MDPRAATARSRGLCLAVLAGCAALVTGCAAGTTGFPDAVSVDAARVNGSLRSSTGGPTSYWAQYGRTTAYGSETAHQSETLVKDTPRSVTLTITGLERNTAYHYRVCARDAEGGGCGQDRLLTTQDVICGQTVTADVRLTGNLDCDTDPLGPVAGPDGLVVGAAGIDINLGGHGIGGGIAQGGGDTGIDNTAGFDDVTVRNGGVAGWNAAVSIEGGSRNTLSSLSLQANPAGVAITGGSDNTVRGASVSARGVALAVHGSPGTGVHGSTLLSAFGAALDLVGDGATVTDSTLGATFGVASVTGSGNRLLRNRVGPNPGSSGPFSGLRVGGGTGNRLIGNEVSHILSVNGVDEGDGILVTADAANTLLRSNRANDNQGDGIDVRDATARLEGNAANSNQDFGIDAAAGVTDLGGNTASGNGNPLQCRNVFCL